jgi:hypothetical protein
MNGKEEKCVNSFWSESQKAECHVGDVGVDGLLIDLIEIRREVIDRIHLA